MIPVKISVLKAKLSYYLGQVRQGREVLVMDRNTPVATLTPARGAGNLVVIPAKKDPKGLKDLKTFKPKHRIDVVKLLREDRDYR